MELVEQIARSFEQRNICRPVVLNMHLAAIGREDLIEHGVDIGTQLELGASSPDLHFSLIELGLSRVKARGRSLRKDRAVDDFTEQRRRLHCLGERTRHAVRGHGPFRATS